MLLLKTVVISELFLKMEIIKCNIILKHLILKL